jgi:hypothetical protein
MTFWEAFAVGLLVGILLIALGKLLWIIGGKDAES